MEMGRKIIKILFLVMLLGAVTVKVDEDLRRSMSQVKINWSDYIRDAIRRRVELEEKPVEGLHFYGAHVCWLRVN